MRKNKHAIPIVTVFFLSLLTAMFSCSVGGVSDEEIADCLKFCDRQAACSKYENDPAPVVPDGDADAPAADGDEEKEADSETVPDSNCYRDCKAMKEPSNDLRPDPDLMACMSKGNCVDFEACVSEAMLPDGDDG